MHDPRNIEIISKNLSFCVKLSICIGIYLADTFQKVFYKRTFRFNNSTFIWKNSVSYLICKFSETGHTFVLYVLHHF